MAVESRKFSRHFLIATFVLHFSFCITSSTSNQESLYNYNKNSLKANTRTLPCFGRYVLESFFKEYDSFTDSNFLEYVEHKILGGSETTYSRLLNIERRLIGEGSHRLLSSSIKYSIQPNLIAGFTPQMCEVIIIERLPSGVFADPFELQHLVHRGVFKDAFVFGDTNLELPSFLSNQSIVEVHLDAAFSNVAEKEILLELKMEIPLHARYPALEESGYSKVRFGGPDVFMRCKMHGKSSAQGCLMSSITSNGALELNDTVWSMPAGIEAHSSIVSAVTFASALLFSTLIIIASLRSSHMEYNGRSKQS